MRGAPFIPMSPYEILVLAFFIGFVTGLRSMMGAALVSWATYLGWLHLENTWVSFMGRQAAVAVFSILAAGELIVDKLPKTPRRTAAPGLIARLGFGALVGTCLALAGKQPGYAGALLGAVGGLTGAFAGYQARIRTVRAFQLPDFVIAVLEDAIAIGGALFIVSRF